MCLLLTDMALHAASPISPVLRVLAFPSAALRFTSLSGRLALLCLQVLGGGTRKETWRVPLRRQLSLFACLKCTDRKGCIKNKC